MKLVRTESYNATSQVLWDYLTDVSLQKKWMSGLKDIQQLGDNRFELHFKERGKVKVYQGETLSREERKHLVISFLDVNGLGVKATYDITSNEPIQGGCAYKVEMDPKDLKTILIYTSDVTAKSIFSKIILYTIGALFFKIILNSQFKKLKQLVESK